MHVEHKPWEWVITNNEYGYSMVKANEETRKKQLKEFKKERIAELKKEIDKIKNMR